jgi:hypothetical protein
MAPTTYSSIVLFSPLVACKIQPFLTGSGVGVVGALGQISIPFAKIPIFISFKTDPLALLLLLFDTYKYVASSPYRNFSVFNLHHHELRD